MYDDLGIGAYFFFTIPKFYIGQRYRHFRPACIRCKNSVNYSNLSFFSNHFFLIATRIPLRLAFGPVTAGRISAGLFVCVFYASCRQDVFRTAHTYSNARTRVSRMQYSFIQSCFACRKVAGDGFFAFFIAAGSVVCTTTMTTPPSTTTTMPTRQPIARKKHHSAYGFYS